jgi:hypothetical protein
MSVFPFRLTIVAAIAAASFLAAPARAIVLDWDTVTTWSPGQLQGSFDLTGPAGPDGINDITVEMTSQQANIWQKDPPNTGTQTPVVNQTLNGGTGENTLMLAADLHTNSNATVHISFTGGPGGLQGASNVSFTLFDIDLSADRDIISNIYGLAPDGITKVAATITNLGSSVSLTGTGLTQVLTGPTVVDNNSSNGNATISFGSTLIYDVFFTFGNSSGPPRYQDIGIGDISFTPVPEINPAATAAASCMAAIGLTALLQRRRRRTLQKAS